MNASKAMIRIACLLLLAAGTTSRAQLLTPLHVGAAGAISNEFGQVLPGQVAAPGGLVLVLWASNSIIYAPDTNGLPHPDNPPVQGGTSAIGRLTSPTLSNPGTFGLSLGQPRLLNGAKVFVRVYNGPDLASSSFYGDSQIFTVSDNKEFEARVAGTTNPLDAADNDSDGLHNSWEESYGTDPESDDTDQDGLSDLAEVQMGVEPTMADSDGDGMIDGHEWRAGTGLLDEQSFLGLAGLTPDQDHLHLSWASVTGHVYQVEAASGDLGGSPAFSNVTDTIPAAPGASTETTLTNELQLLEQRIYRVRLVEDP
jgi:hypothetical protein